MKVCDMQVLIEAHTKAQEEAAWIFGGLARFVMVARDNDTGEAFRNFQKRECLSFTDFQ